MFRSFCKTVQAFTIISSKWPKNLSIRCKSTMEGVLKAQNAQKKESGGEVIKWVLLVRLFHILYIFFYIIRSTDINNFDNKNYKFTRYDRSV